MRTPLLRVAIIEESRNDSEYHILLSSKNDTVRDILAHKRINPNTNNVFINGKLICEELYERAIGTFTSTTTVFITVKCKTIDRNRQASIK